MNKEFFALLFNSLNDKYNISGMPPFIGRFSEVQCLPPEKCNVPVYCWQKENNDVVLSFNTPLLEGFAARLAMEKEFFDLTVKDIFDCLKVLIDLKRDAFAAVMAELSENQKRGA